MGLQLIQGGWYDSNRQGGAPRLAADTNNASGAVLTGRAGVGGLVEATARGGRGARICPSPFSAGTRPREGEWRPFYRAASP